MSRLARQVRRTKDKLAQRSRKRIFFKIAFIIGLLVSLFCLLGVVYWYLIFNKQQDTRVNSPKSTITSTKVVFSWLIEHPPSGFVKLMPQSPTTVIDLIRKFVNGYARWMFDHKDKTITTQADVEAEFQTLLIDLEHSNITFKTLGSQSISDLSAINERLNIYLQPRGWIINIGKAPIQPHKVAILTVWMGQIRAVKRDKITTFYGKTLPFATYLVDLDARICSPGIQALTSGTKILLFHKEAAIAASEARSICREAFESPPKKVDSMEWFVWHEFAPLFLRLGDSVEFEQIAAQRILVSTMAHELQHVRDLELQLKSLAALKYTARKQLRGFGEARAILADIIHGETPSLTLGNVLVSWHNIPGEYREASDIVRFLFGADFDPLKAEVYELRRRATKGLTLLDRDYFALLKHAHTENPVQTMLMERKKVQK